MKINQIVYGHVYITTNLINGKQYVGHSTKQIGSNQEKNYFGSGNMIDPAIKKYGKQNFKKEILRICYSEKQMYNWELIYKIKFNSFKPIGYNILKISEGRSPACDPEIAAKMALTKKGKCIGKDNPNYNNKWSDEQKQNLSKSRKEFIAKLTSEERAAIYFPRNMPAGHYDLLSHNLKKKWENPEYREFMINIAKSVTIPEESRKRAGRKISVKQSGTGNSFYNHKHSEETKKSMKENRKGRSTYNNGFKEIHLKEDQKIPFGFRKGGISRSKLRGIKLLKLKGFNFA